MEDVILKVENISKQYRLGTLGTGTISHDLNRWWHTIRGKEDPYLKIGETNNRETKGESQYVWSLKDISFDVKRGDVLGIIGKNGAGKSTLLKILSKVTGPTTGSIKTKGRIASLLEVGTGFHPEMTGKENIYLNGAILGMTKKEISNKIDEIIEFSGCERYINTPVKRYSSGMKVRLAFAVAAFLEPDILVVDEVLAVGDAEFQKKAIGKMQDISNSQGRTVLFVSHNMVAVKKLCNKAIVLHNGKVVFEGEVDKAIDNYYNQNKDNNSKSSNGIYDLNKHQDKKYKDKGLQKAKLYVNDKLSNTVVSGSEVRLLVSYNSEREFYEAELGFGITDSDQNSYIRLNNKHIDQFIEVTKGNREIEIIIKDFPIYSPGVYFISLFFGDKGPGYEILENCIEFEIKEIDVFGSGRLLENKWNKIYHKDILINSLK